MNRYPYHRYLRYLVLEGDDVESIRRHIGAELGFFAPLEEDVQFLIDTLYAGRLITEDWRKKNEVDLFEEAGHDMEQAHWIVETGPARAVAEKALLDRVSARNTATILSMKFGLSYVITERAVSLFRRGWWDTESLTAVDFARYYRLRGERKPDPPPGVPLHMRPAAAAWAEGVLPDETELSTDDIVRSLQVDAFMHYERARSTPGAANQEEARKWAVIALRTSQLRKPKTPAKGAGATGQGTLPGLKPAIYTPDQATPSIEDIQAVNAGDEDDGDAGEGNDDPI